MSPFNEEHREFIRENELKKRHPEIFEEGRLSALSGQPRFCHKSLKDEERAVWYAGFDEGKREETL